METFADTHSHIYDEAFRKDFDTVVQRCREAGVTTLVMPAISSPTYEDMLNVADALPDMAFPCIGLHPTELAANWEEEMSFVEAHLHDRKFVAIGEIGLDRHWSDEFFKEQKTVFARQLEIAAQENLPVIIHSRDATEEIFKTFDDLKGVPLRGVFHAFSGSYETYRRCLSCGDFKFGIGGVLTYKKAGIAEVLPKMSPDDIILETDCPWLTPVPHRGERNESAYVRIIAQKVADLTGLSLGEVASRTTSTAKSLFNL